MAPKRFWNVSEFNSFNKLNFFSLKIIAYLLTDVTNGKQQNITS